MTIYATYEEKLDGKTGSEVESKDPRKVFETEAEFIQTIIANKEKMKELAKENEKLMNCLPVQTPMCLEVDGIMTTIIVDRPSVQAVVLKHLDFTMKCKTTKKDLEKLGS